MDNWEKKKIAVICVIVLLCLGFSLWDSLPKELEETAVSAERQLSEPEKLQGITVYISGAVKNPGIYKVEAGVRAVDAIAIAGGMSEDANKNKVNLAKKCKDGTQVNVPFLSAKQKKEREQGKDHSIAASKYKALHRNKLPANDNDIRDNKVNLNTATQKELETLPGIGESTAKKIIVYRAKQKFKVIEDIMQISGIGHSKFIAMQELLEV
ncbi:MAG: helix-hairpin-helix domain-containing protein [Acidaminococcaceae bacterium]|nr:helix-hairpin-helix domain-containing protein [Acidaminococcaceae bacterium]